MDTVNSEGCKLIFCRAWYSEQLCSVSTLQRWKLPSGLSLHETAYSRRLLRIVLQERNGWMHSFCTNVYVSLKRESLKCDCTVWSNDAAFILLLNLVPGTASRGLTQTKCHERISWPVLLEVVIKTNVFPKNILCPCGSWGQIGWGKSNIL